jgi:5-methylcytosine-specific restriction endonuclease McrA
LRDKNNLTSKETMVIRDLISFFGRFHIKDEPATKSLPDDESLLKKIRGGSKPKYINLETGRSILPSSATKKKHVDDKYFFCGNDTKQFERISRKIAQSPENYKTEATKKLIKAHPKPHATSKKSERTEGSPRKRKTIPKTLRHYLWMRDYGNISEAKCICCGVITITESTAEAGHIVAFSKGGSNDVKNLRLICRTCNVDMGTQNMDEFMKANNFPLGSRKK